MILRKIYYSLKPMIPWTFRAMLRRQLISYKTERNQDIWPIDPMSTTRPENWQGWPEGKQFAVVLTHDVESAEGVAQVEKLMRLEQSLGFKSSFNFVPEGYHTPPALRELLVRNGFEVGIHDLKHDGKLYTSREHFIQAAARINQYAKDWKVEGFRSAFMLHNLEWLLDLDMKYDASTFDTDPFEPQPEPARTIYPFWVQGPNNRGYIEFPYTLPQDSTLFVYGKHKDASVWCQKADWLVDQGAMVLVNVHPDYLAFDGATPKPNQFRAEIYAELLQHIRDKYAGQYWHGLPKELARHCATFKPQHPGHVPNLLPDPKARAFSA